LVAIWTTTVVKMLRSDPLAILSMPTADKIVGSFCQCGVSKVSSADKLRLEKAGNSQVQNIFLMDGHTTIISQTFFCFLLLEK
jgi:hypothetical protein